MHSGVFLEYDHGNVTVYDNGHILGTKDAIKRLKELQTKGGSEESNAILNDCIAALSVA